MILLVFASYMSMFVNRKMISIYVISSIYVFMEYLTLNLIFLLRLAYFCVQNPV